MRRFASDVRAAAERFRLDQGFLLASALSFAFLLCLAPLALILFSIAGFLLESEDIAEYIVQYATLLVPAYGDEVMEFLKLLMRERTVTGAVGAVSMAIFVSRLFALTRIVVNRAFRVAVRRGPIRGFLFDLSAVVVVGSLLVAYTVALIVLAALGDFAVRQAPVPLPDLPLKGIASVALVYLAGCGLLFFVYQAFPNTRVPVRAAVTATVTVALLWVAARRAFGAYVAVFGFYGKLYGSFGIGVAVLVWIYYSTTIFIFGAELAAIVAERIGAPPPSPAPAPTDAWVQSSP
ncbi:MAG: YihY/virulence factor BrkB family protein [Candidatus Rokuibacteriota bacterium]